MTRNAFTGGARVAGVVGAPVRHSLSPLIHNAWIGEIGLDAAYVPFSLAPDRFAAFVNGMRGGPVVGLNVTLPFKPAALALADQADAAARACGAANLLLFSADGRIEARNTDGAGIMQAFAEQAPHWSAAGTLVVVLGAGGAARAAVATLSAAGARVRVVNRTERRAVELADAFAGVESVRPAQVAQAFSEASAVVNATAAGLGEIGDLKAPLAMLPPDAVVMDMVYTPLQTPLLRRARALGLTTVDGLAMLIGQAEPSFQALFDNPVPRTLDVRRLALAALGEG